MRPCVRPPLVVRTAEFGGPRPMICVPLVAADSTALLSQASAARALAPDVVEWRADSYDDLSVEGVLAAARDLRGILDQEPLIFTLRAKEEGGARPLSQPARSQLIQSVLAAGLADIVDVELRNGPDFIQPIMTLARHHGVRVIVSFHDFESMPSASALLTAAADMARCGADIAKLACMARDAGDGLRLLETTLAARRTFPSLPLCTLAMGELGIITRVTGFLFGSDMTFASGTAASAPGQIPIGELKAMIDMLLRHA